MKKLSMRERVLLMLLAVIAVVSGYVLFFYMPTSQQTETLQTQIAQAQELSAQIEDKLASQQQMQRELEQLAAQGTQTPYMPAYDNLQAVMVELHSILAGCQEYSLSFQGEQGEEHVFYRRVLIPFTCGSYTQAREILQKLHNSALRGVLEQVQMTEQENGTVTVSASMLFLEYQAEVPEDEAAGDEATQEET